MIPLFAARFHDTEILAALTGIEKAMRSGYVAEGSRCAELEAALSKAAEMPLRLVNSGTSALRLAFHLAGARPGTEVIVTPQTCLATCTAILETGARIVWADIDPVTGNLDEEDAAAKVTPKTVAICGVDWAGRLCEWRKLRSLTRGVALVEDAAHAWGAERLMPSDRGDYVTFSYQAIKHVTCGDGGAIACPGDYTHERARLLRWFGLDRTSGESMRCYQNPPEAGFKMQGNDIMASVGLASLAGATERLARHRENAAWLHSRLDELPHVALPLFDPGSSWWMFPVLVSRPIAFERFMTSRGIAVGQVHARCDGKKCFDYVAESRGPLPGVDAFAAHQSNLPCGSHISPADLDSIVHAVEAWTQQPEARW